MILPIRIAVFERGANGVPPGAYLGDLADVISYRHSISDRFGFETMQATFATTLEDAQDWLGADRLMRSCVVYGPDGEEIWEGFLETIEVTLGQEKRSITLRDLANRVTVKYTTTDGGAASMLNDDAASRALYGRRERVLTAGTTTFNGALNKMHRALYQLALPRARATSAIQTGQIGRVQVVLSFVGWYATLGWVTTFRTSTTLTSTTTQVGDLIQASGVGIGVINPIISTTREHILSSGISDVETIANETTYLQKIEQLLDQGTSANQAFVWGVYNDREFWVALSSENFPTTIQYQRYLSDNRLLDVYGNTVPYWDAQPIKMYQVNDLLDSLAAPTLPIDGIGRSYVARVVCDLDRNRWSLTLEGSSGDSIDKLIARIH